MASSDEEHIAIVGLWCRFPHADGPDDFWRVLVNGEDCVEELPPDRRSQGALYDANKNTGNNSVERYKEFDPGLFGLTDEEASLMDPQQRFMLECSYKAFENAGITMEDLDGSDTGVFVGATHSDHLSEDDVDPTQAGDPSISGAAASLLAARVSYTFNLTGPALTVDTACSSGLYAVHLGCQAIRADDCFMAICGGVSFIRQRNMLEPQYRAGTAGPDGRCKPFSAAAGGHVRGEGCGVVVLKRLQRALEHKDHIWAVIRTGVNQDGRTAIPITAPSQTQQEELLRLVYEHHKIDPQDIDYIEAHGTGTPDWDTVEASSLGNTIGKARKPGDPPVLLGSVKSNIGHLESAAAMAGIIKVLLMMKHEKVVPTLQFHEPNPNIDLDSLRLCVPTEVQDWPLRGKDRRLACVNSFGLNGSNAHAILEQLQLSRDGSDYEEEETKDTVVALSARKRESLRLAAEDLIDYLRRNPGISVQRLAYTSTMRRTHHDYRLAVYGSSVEDIERSLTKALNEIEDRPETRTERQTSPVSYDFETDKRVIFVFGGQGTLWEGVCLDLMDKESVFRKKLTEIDSLFGQYVDWSLLNKLSNREDFDVPIVAQALIFSTQVALFALWQWWGITPHAILGHSVGEVAAAHCSGVLPLPEAVRVIYHRGRLQNETRAGKMLVVGNLPIEEVEELCKGVSGDLSVAVENSATCCVLSGDRDAIHNIHELLKSMDEESPTRQLFLREVQDVKFAYHSHHMEPIREELQASLADLTGHPPEVELYSTVTGVRATPNDFVTGDYWGRNVRQRVMFRSAMSESLRPEKHNVVVGIGPKAPKRSYIKQLAADTKFTYVASVMPNQEYPTMLQGLCELYQAGLLPRWDSLFQGRKYTPYQVPRYHFARRLLWSKTDKTLARRQDLGVKCGSSPTTHPLLTRVSTDPLQYECLMSRQKMPYLYDYVHDGTVVVPGAQYCDLGIAACMDVIFTYTRQLVSYCRTSVTFLTPVTLPSQDGTTVIRVMVNHYEAAKKVHFEQRTDRDLHATGTVIYSNRQQPTLTRLDIEAIRYRCNNAISGDDLYEALQTTGLQYGPTLHRLTECRYGEGTHGKEAMAVIHVHDTVAAEMHSCCIHPAILDCLMQTCFLLEFDILRQTNGRRLKLLPVSIESLVVVRPVEEHMCTYVKQTGGTPWTIRSNGVLVGMDGQVILELRGLTFRMCTDGNSSSFEDLVFTTTWTPAQSQWGGEVEPKLVNEFCELKCLVLQDDCGISNQLEPFVSSDSVFISLEDFKRTDYRNDESALPKLLQEMDVNLNFDFVLHCCGISQLDPEKLDAEALDTRVELACASLRQVMKMLITDGSRVPVKIITRNVQFSMWQESLDSDVDSAWHGLLDLAGAPMWGLIRCAIREGAYPLLQLVDLSSGNNFEIYTLLHELVARELESYTEIMCVQSAKYYLEIVPSTLRSESTMHRINNAEEGCRLKIQTTGPTKPANIHAVYSNKRVESQPGHVMVKVQRCHVQPENMNAVTSEAQNGYVIHWYHDADHGWDFLSLDFVGTVVQVPPKCKFRLGDRVIGVYPAVASSVVSLPVSVVQKLSDLPLLQNQPCLSYFVLAWEILVHLLDIKPKQNVCLLEETTGTPSVMARVIEAVALGLKAICYIAQDVYSLSSVKGGVAVVIGGLHAPLRAQLAEVIGRNGKVVCLCGQNQQTSASLRIRPDVRVLIVDTSTVFHETNLKMIMPNVSKLLSVQFQRKLNIDLPFTQIPLSSSPHKAGIHDVVTTSRAEIPVVGFGVQSEDGLPGTPVICGRKALFRRDASYVIVDGLTGLGFFTIEFLAERGAGNIVTVSRTQPQADTVTELRRVGEKYGSKIICLVADVTSYKSMTAALDKLRDCLPGIPLKGVFHSATVFSDRILINQSHAQFKMGLDVKVVGTWNLHLMTRHLNLDYFVCYSSMSSVLGTGGQTSYGAANAFLDGIACLRRQMHMVGQSINWGALQLKTLQRDKRMAKILEQNGIRDLYKDRVSECLENCLLLNPVQLIVVDLDQSRLAAMTKRFPDVRRFEKLVGDIDDVTADDVLLSTAVDLDRLGQMSEQGRREAIGALTRNVFVNLLNAEPGDVHTMQRSIVNMGMDSLLALTAQNIFKNKFQVDVPWIALLGKKSTIESINDQVFEQLNKRISERQQPVALSEETSTDGRHHKRHRENST